MSNRFPPDVKHYPQYENTSCNTRHSTKGGQIPALLSPRVGVKGEEEDEAAYKCEDHMLALSDVVIRD